MKVLLAIDDSKFSKAAVESVIRRPWWSDTQFMVLSVVPVIAPIMSDWHQAQVQAIVEAQAGERSLHEELVEKTVNYMKENLPICRVEGCTKEGLIKEEIVNKAKEWGADFIIMGSHGRTGLTRFLMGSVAEAVMQSAPCSIEIVHAA